jgi:hypothetical protein
MDLAVRTTASPAAIWTIAVVAVVLLAFWLIMIWYADAHPYVRQSQLPDMPGPGAAMLDDDGLANLGAAPPQAAQPGAATEPEAARVPTQRGQAAPAPAVGAAEPPAEPIPGQRTPAGDSAPTETANRPGAGNQT